MYSWSKDIEWQVAQAVAGEIENREARGPICHIWDFGEPIVGEIEFFQVRQLQKAFWDSCQLVVLEINLDNL